MRVLCVIYEAFSRGKHRNCRHEEDPQVGARLADGSWEHCSGNNWHLGVLPSSVQWRCIKHTAQKFKRDQITLVLLFTEQIVEKMNRWAEVGNDTGIVKQGWSSRSPKVQRVFRFVEAPCILLTGARM